MSISIESLGIHQLSVTERLDLIDQIWDSLPERIEPREVPEWHLAELAQRLSRMKSEPVVGKPWREILDRLDSNS